MTYAKDIKCKLYLEGIEFPFNTVTISESIKRPTQAVFTVAANSKISFLLPKTLAHLFYYVDGKYRLIYEGELSHINFVKSKGKRSINLTFTGLTYNWTQVFMKSMDFYTQNFAGAHFYAIGSRKDGRKQALAENLNIVNRDIDEDQFKNDITRHSWFFSEQYKMGSLALVFMRALKENDDSLQKTINSFLTYIREENLYYPVIDNALHLNDRVKVLNNTEANKFLRKQAWIGFLENELNGLPSLSNLITILDYIFKFLVYEWVEIAAPTFTNDNKIKNIFMKPHTDYFLPIRCNMIFPDQVLNQNFNRNFLAEPTRMQFEPMQLKIKGSESTGLKALFAHYAPYTEIIKLNGLPKIDLTKEEKYRGLQPAFGKQPTLAERAYVTMFNEEKGTDKPEKQNKIINRAKNDVTNKLKDGDASEFLSQWLDYQFCNHRFNSRRLEVTTIYTPYRLVGFTGIVLDTVLPSIVGTIEGITSTISTDGQGTQSIIIGRPRLYLDSEIAATFDPSEDSAPHFPYYFDNTYNADSIGTEHYRGILNNIDRETEDGSIWAYVLPEENTTLQAKLNVDNVSPAEQEALKLGQAIESLKKQYNRFAEDRHLFINQQTKRRLVTEKEWWDYLNIYKDDNNMHVPSHTNNYRIAANLEVGDQKQTEESFEDITTGYKPTDISTPFVKERQDKVREVIQ